MSNAIILSLKRFTTCDISDALLKKGVKNGGYLPDIYQRTLDKPQTTFPIVGKAWTVRFVQKSSSEQPDFVGHYIDQIPLRIAAASSSDPNWQVVPVLGAPKHLNCAVFGGIMALRASMLGAVAVIVGGRVRDVDEMNAPESTAAVFSSGLSTVGAGADSKVNSIGTQCEINGYGTVVTGDTVVIDKHGVVIIPTEFDLADLVQLMEKLTTQDEKVKDSVRAGMTVEAAFKKWRS